MEWVERMQAALDYVEDNLAGDLNVNDIAQRANASSFHFQRMFFALCGVSLAEYVRRRRLTMAAKDLIASECTITEIAARYGYENQASFTRAYGKLHGHSPGKTRQSGLQIVAYPPLRFTLIVKGENKMNYEITKKPSYRLVGKQWTVSTQNGENFRVIPEHWSRVTKDGTMTALSKRAAKEGLFSGACLGVAVDFDDANEEFTYLIGVESDARDLPSDWHELVVDSMTYAVFKDQGYPLSGALKKTFNRIYQEWFPSTGYERAVGPEVEVYLDDNRYEVWIPVETR